MKFLLCVSYLLARTVPKVRVNHEEENLAVFDKLNVEIEKVSSVPKGTGLLEIFNTSVELKNVEDFQKASSIIRRFSEPSKEIIDVIPSLESKVTDPVEELKRGERFFAIYFVDKDSALIPAEHEDDGVMLYISFDKDLAASLNVPFPGVYGFNPIDKTGYVVSLDDKKVKNFTAILKTPIVGPITHENFGIYRNTDLPLFYVFTKIDQIEETRKKLLEKAKGCKALGKFVLVAWEPSRIDLSFFGLSEESLPGLVFMKGKYKYPLKSIYDADIKKFIEDVLEDKVEPLLVSQPEPEDNATRDVKVVTRNNLFTHLQSGSKDRLIIFSSPDCRFCVQLKPVVEELGKIVKANADDKLFVGNCDITTNDITDIQVDSVPLIYLIKANTNERMQFTTNSKDLLSLTKFIKEHGTYNVDLQEFVKKPVEEEPKASEPVPESFNEKEEL